MTDDLMVYAKGLVCISVCAPVDWTREQVQHRANAMHPCGTERGWMISEDKYFSDGKTLNGGAVECHRGKSRHWLLSA